MSLIETDRLSEIISKYLYEETDSIQLLDIDAWDVDDLQEALAILDNEVAERCNEALDDLFDEQRRN